MKKIWIITTILCLFTACSTNKKVAKSINETLGTEVVITMPLKESNTQDTKDMYRGVGEGKSTDITVAKNIAFTNCRGELATKLKSQVRQALENYAEQYGSDDKIDLEEHFRQHTLTYSNIVLRNTNVLEIVITRNSNDPKRVTAYVAMEISKDYVVEELVKTFDNSSKENIKNKQNDFKEYLEKTF
jgi:hypothetical protein